MRNLCFTIALMLNVLNAIAAESYFKVEPGSETANNYAIGFGIPNVKLDFDRLDQLSEDDLLKELQFESIKNFVVDTKSNKILYVHDNADDMKVFTIGNYHFGNHYNLSVKNVAVQNINNQDVLWLIDSYKWNDYVSNIILINKDKNNEEVVLLNSSEMLATFHAKVKESILEKNMDWYENASETIISLDIKTHKTAGEINVINLDYTFPKQDKNSLNLVVAFKLKMINNQLVPFILDVKQNQY